MNTPRTLTWLARLAVGIVFCLNVSCALAFIFQPDLYTPGFETGGLPGRTLVQALGIAFLMWNVPYLPLIVRPGSQKVLYGVVLAQQIVGLVGETWLWRLLPTGHAALAATGLRFIVFDGLGLVLMAIPYGLLLRRNAA